MSPYLSQQSTQAIIGIVFGIIIFLLAMMTLWQGYRHRCRSDGTIFANEESGAANSSVDGVNIENGISTTLHHRPNRGNGVIILRITFFNLSDNGARPFQTIETSLSHVLHQPQSSTGYSEIAGQTLSGRSTTAPSFTTEHPNDAGDIGCQGIMLHAEHPPSLCIKSICTYGSPLRGAFKGSPRANPTPHPLKESEREKKKAPADSLRAWTTANGCPFRWELEGGHWREMV